MSAVALLMRQARFDLLTFRRDPAATFFTVALPVIFMVLFISLFGDDTEVVAGREIDIATFYVPGIMVLSLVSATFVNLAINLTTYRERGTLKRLRGTPLPAWVFIGGRIIAAVVIVIAMLIAVVVVGLLYGVDLPPARAWVGLLLALVVGTAAFSCLGIALTAIIPTENAAPAIANALVLPLYFISGVFIPITQAPEWVARAGEIFPIRHLYDAAFAAYEPGRSDLAIEWASLGLVALWGLLGALVALRFFSWTPGRR